MNTGVLVAVGLWFLSQHVSKLKEDAKTLTFVPIDVQAKSLNDIKLIMQISNPSTSEFKIDSLNASITYQNKVIGTISRPDPFVIPKDKTTVSFAVKPEAGQAVATLITLLFEKGSAKTVNVVGSYKYYGIAQPISKTISLRV